MIIEKVTTSRRTQRVCDVCKSPHTYDSCSFCNKDLCTNHKFNITRRLKVRKYNYANEHPYTVCENCLEIMLQAIKNLRG